jgi:hypothetical protein
MPEIFGIFSLPGRGHGASFFKAVDFWVPLAYNDMKMRGPPSYFRKQIFKGATSA